MGKRREGREAALQFLYQLDLSEEVPAELFTRFWELRSGPGKAVPTAKTRVFTEQLVSGVAAHRPEIDERIQKHSTNYDLSRIAMVDRNILRMGIYEMLYSPDVPPVVIINEAIEVAKKFGSEESGRFINGILDRVRGELSRPAREPATGG
ncbi:MAG TPA: transcription antitermination factor NusB [Chthoniobacteraceae bacterium]|jgi:N utilization substance protein B